jgi:hypothetical protein
MNERPAWEYVGVRREKGGEHNITAAMCAILAAKSRQMEKACVMMGP